MNEFHQMTETIYAAGMTARFIAGAGLVVVALLGVLAWREYHRRRSAAVFFLYGLRLVSLGVASWMLAQPTARSILEQSHRKAFAVLADASESMTVADVISPLQQVPERRIDQVVSILENAEASWIPGLAAKARVMRYGFDTVPVPIASQNWSDLEKSVAIGKSTNLSAALEQIVRDRSGEDLRAVVLLSDGGHNTGPDPLTVVSALQNVSVYVVPIGNTRPVRDVSVHHAQAPRAVLQNDSIVIDATLDVQGCEGEQVLVQLLRNSDVVDEQHITVSSESQSRRVTFVRKAEQIGLERLTVQAMPLSQELTSDNNQASVDVQIAQGRIPVLLVDHYPRWEYRFLRNLLRRDEQTELDYILLSPPDSGRGSDPVAISLPRTADEWERYRVVVLGDVGPDRLIAQQQAQLAEYVSRGGGTLILIAGERMPAGYAGRPLEPLLPVLAEASVGVGHTSTMLVTPEGAESTVSQLTADPLDDGRVWQEQFSGPFGLSRLNAWCRPKPTAHVLLEMIDTSAGSESSEAPQVFLCWQRFGRGKVIYLSAPITYLLRQRHSDLYHHRFWGQMLRWASARDLPAGSQTVQIATDKSRYTSGEDVQATVRLRQLNGEPVSAAEARLLARRGGETIAQTEFVPDEAVPGLYRGSFQGLSSGAVSIEAEGPQIRELLDQERPTGPVAAEVVVEPPDSLEMRATRCNLALLSQIAQATGGRIVSAAELKETMGAIDLTPEISRQVLRQPLWDRWPYLLALVGCLTLEWGLRKWMGLL